jgi:hypothetical protein
MRCGRAAADIGKKFFRHVRRQGRAPHNGSEGKRLPGYEGKAIRTRQEFEAAIGRFSDGDWARLDGLARSFAFCTGWESDDLLQEAIVRTLQGTRNCPTSVDVIKHLADTMSSIADTERSKGPNKHPHVPIVQRGLDLGEDPSSPNLSPEDTLVYRGEHAELLKLFDDDPIAKEMVEGILAGFDTDELKKLTGLQGTAYDSKRTLIRRRLQKFDAKRHA